MLVISWNVNSLPARMPRLLELLAEHTPDVVCLQETKCRPETFPHLELQVAGYTAVDHSTGGRNGVAILVRDGCTVSGVVVGLPGEPHPDQGRWVQATVEDVTVASVYVPNGRHPDHPDFADKLVFLDAMIGHVTPLAGSTAAGGDGARVLIAGDVNVAPGDLDVHDPVRYIGGSHTSDRERARLRALADLGLSDVYRTLNPDAQQFTWWDYRAGNFHKNLGMRIDLFLASSALTDRITRYEMLRPYRKGARPSDHAPILLAST